MRHIDDTYSLCLQQAVSKASLVGFVIPANKLVVSTRFHLLDAASDTVVKAVQHLLLSGIVSG